MAWLLDTNVLSELRKPRVNPRVTAFTNGTPLDKIYVSIVTLAEIRHGVERAPDGVRVHELEYWLDKTVRTMFERRVLPLSEDVLVLWRGLAVDGQRVGRTYSQPDLLLAATALEYGMRLVTRNVKDFTGLPVSVFNPWEEEMTRVPV